MVITNSKLSFLAQQVSSTFSLEEKRPVGQKEKSIR